MESILVDLISEVFTIAGNFYDDLQSVPFTIDELKQAFEKAGVTVSENSIEELTLHLENLASVSRHKLGHARILTEREEKILQEYEEDCALEAQLMMEADESENELRRLLEEGEDIF